MQPLFTLQPSYFQPDYLLPMDMSAKTQCPQSPLMPMSNNHKNGKATPQQESTSASKPACVSAQHALINEFYQRHNSWLHSWLSKKLGSSFDAADLAQDTFLRVLLKTDLVSILEPRAYLTRIAHDLMVNLIRRREIERSYLEELAQLPEYQAPSGEQRAIAVEALVAIDRMLDGLPRNVRNAFLLSQLDGMTHAEIAAELEVSVASVRLYIAKALTHCLIMEHSA